MVYLRAPEAAFLQAQAEAFLLAPGVDYQQGQVEVYQQALVDECPLVPRLTTAISPSGRSSFANSKGAECTNMPNFFGNTFRTSNAPNLALR